MIKLFNKKETQNAKSLHASKWQKNKQINEIIQRVQRA